MMTRRHLLFIHEEVLQECLQFLTSSPHRLGSWSFSSCWSLLIPSSYHTLWFLTDFSYRSEKDNRKSKKKSRCISLSSCWLSSDEKRLLNECSRQHERSTECKNNGQEEENIKDRFSRKEWRMNQWKRKELTDKRLMWCSVRLFESLWGFESRRRVLLQRTFSNALSSLTK